MSTWNKKQTTAQKLTNHPDATKNHEGGLAYTMSQKMELYTRVASCLVGQDKFYTSGSVDNQDLSRVLAAVIKEDPEFVLALARYTRNKLYLRAIPIALLAEVANQAPGQVKGARKYVPQIIRRADEINELLAYQIARNKGTSRGKQKIPNLIQKGLADTMNRFSAYQYAKYNRDGDVTFRDAVFICHPKPKNDEQRVIFEHIVNQTLPIPDTWETIISGEGSTKESWEKAAEVTPIMATVRNLRNFAQHDISNMDTVLARLRDPEVISKSKMLPFRFFSAWREISRADVTGKSKILSALDDAMNISVANVPKIRGRTLILVDSSASMDNPVSRNSAVTASDIAELFGAMADKICDDATVVAFGDSWAEVGLSKSGSILDNKDKIRRADVGHATYCGRALMGATSKGQKYDRVILFSDMQCYSGGGYSDNLAAAFIDYRHKVSPNCRLYSIDLMGYGTTQLPKDTVGVYTIAGWSEKIFDFINAIEVGEEDILKMIRES